MDGAKAWVGGEGFITRVDLAGGRVVRTIRLPAVHRPRALTRIGGDLWFGAGPGLYRVPVSGDPDVFGARDSSAETGAPISDLAGARAALQARQEVKRIYGTVDVPEYAALTARHLDFVRRAARAFTVLPIPTRTPTNISWFVSRMMNEAGLGFDGFRFRCSLTEAADLGWIFANEVTGSFASWWIYPMEGAPLDGFRSILQPTMVYTNAPWSATPGHYQAVLQFLPNGQLQPGREYILWFEFRDSRAAPMFFAADLFPASAQHSSRTVLEGAFGLSGPKAKDQGR